MAARVSGERLLTIPEVADRLGVGRRSVYRLIACGLPVVDVGTARRPRTRVPESALATWVDRHTRGGTGRRAA